MDNKEKIKQIVVYVFATLIAILALYFADKTNLRKLDNNTDLSNIIEPYFKEYDIDIDDIRDNWVSVKIYIPENDCATWSCDCETKLNSIENDILNLSATNNKDYTIHIFVVNRDVYNNTNKEDFLDIYKETKLPDNINYYHLYHSNIIQGKLD